MEKKELIALIFSKLPYLTRILLIGSAISILIASFFFPDPHHDPLSLGLNPRLSQTLVYGGIVVFLALYTWWWPSFGGIITIIYGCYKIFGNFLNILSGHDPFTRNLFTLVPTPVYHALYGIFIVGGILSIIVGLSIKTTRIVETVTSKKLRIISLIITLSSIIVAILYTFGIAIFIRYNPPSNPPDYLVGGVFYLAPLLLILTYLAWKWAAQGGLLELLFMGSLLLSILTSRWELEFTIPCVIFCSILIFIGFLNIAQGFITRKHIADISI